MDLIESDTGWRVEAHPSISRFGTEQKETKNFTPLVYLENASSANTAVLATMREIGSSVRASVVVENTLTDPGARYLNNQLPGLDTLMPAIFRTATVGPREAEDEQTAIGSEVIHTVEGAEYNIFSGLFEAVDFYTDGRLDMQATATVVVVIGAIVVGVFAVIGSGGASVIAVLVFVLILGGGIVIGWVDRYWGGAIMALQIFVLGWILFLKKS